MGRDGQKGCIGMVVLVLFVLCVLVFIPSWFESWISIEEATIRFAELAEVPESEILVVRHSNNSFLLGDPNDVTFELRIQGNPVSGRCTSDVFSPMVCRLYEGE